MPNDPRAQDLLVLAPVSALSISNSVQLNQVDARVSIITKCRIWRFSLILGLFVGYWGARSDGVLDWFSDAGRATES